MHSVYTILTSFEGYEADGSGLILRTTPLSIPDSDGEQVALGLLQLAHCHSLSLHPSIGEGRVGVGGSVCVSVLGLPGIPFTGLRSVQLLTATISGKEISIYVL